MTKRHAGYVALISLIIIGIVASTIAAFLLLGGVGATQSSRNVESSTLARAAAQSCAELGLAAIQANTSLTTPASGSTTLDATLKQTCSYSVTGTTPNYTVVGVGQVDASGKNTVRRVTVVIDQVLPQIRVASWRDTP